MNYPQLEPFTLEEAEKNRREDALDWYLNQVKSEEYLYATTN